MQADAPYRNRVSSLGYALRPLRTIAPPPAANTFTSSTGSVMTPLSALVDTQIVKSAPVITHYNLYRSIELSGNPAPGHGSGEAIEAMQQIAKQVLPPGVELRVVRAAARRDRRRQHQHPIFALGIIFVFLVLAAQYESYIDPLIVLLAVPAALLGALLFMNFRRHRSRCRSSSRPDMVPGRLRAGRLRDAHRPGQQERHFDRRVCQPADARRRDRSSKPPCAPLRRGCGRS